MNELRSSYSFELPEPLVLWLIEDQHDFETLGDVISRYECEPPVGLDD